VSIITIKSNTTGFTEVACVNNDNKVLTQNATNLTHGGHSWGVSLRQKFTGGDKVAVATAMSVQRVQNGVLDTGVALR
jgi:hypothetical protein